MLRDFRSLFLGTLRLTSFVLPFFYNSAFAIEKPLPWIPANAKLIVHARPPQLLKQISNPAIYAKQAAEFQISYGVSLADIESITLAWAQPEDEVPEWSSTSNERGMVLRMSKDTKFTIPSNGLREIELAEIHGRPVQYVPLTDTAWFQADKKTLVCGRSGFVTAAIEAGLHSDCALMKGYAWDELAHSHFLFVGASNTIEQILMRTVGFENAGVFGFVAAGPIFDTKSMAFGISLENEMTLRGMLECDHSQRFENIKETIQSFSTLFRNILNTPPAAEDTHTLAMRSLEPLILAALKAMEIDQPAERIVNIKTQIAGFKDFEPVFQAFVAERNDRLARLRSRHNLMLISLALHNHHDARRGFPAANSTRDTTENGVLKKGQPVSWRVLLLPYLESEAFALYEMYHFDEPWDSEHNKKLLAKMPDVYRHPLDDPKSTNTSYFVLTGRETMFSGNKGILIRDLADGGANTLLVVEAMRAVPWTKPEDIEYADEKAIPPLGGWFRDGFCAESAKLKSLFITKDTSKELLRALIERNDDKEIDMSLLEWKN